ncbi:MAG: NAD-dependent epimerase/dehydratase family protein [Kiritimatiellae bacterium]|nr:NAD-dependent epimerase/dehydratase family protein [Kiritimatiellia bacterium]
MKTIFLTGRNGFVGQTLAEKLKPHCRIASCIRRKLNTIDYARETLVVKDVRALTTEDVCASGATCIVHLAAQIRGAPQVVAANNIEVNETVFGIARRLDLPVIYLSSTNVLFADCLGGYAHSKQKGELILKTTGQPYLIVRAPLLIGESSFSVKTIRSFYRTFRVFPLFGPQEGKVQPVPISAFSNFMASTIQDSRFTNVTLNVIGKMEYTYRMVLEGILSKYAPVRFLHFPYRISLAASKRLEYLHLPFLASSEEIKSVNMDKIVKPEHSASIHYIDNESNALFGIGV